MSKGLKALVGTFAVLSIVIVGLRTFQVPISMALIERQIAANMERDVIGSLPDGLHVGLCGAAGPFPNRDRRAGCAFVVAGRSLYVVDAGSGAAGNLGVMGLGVGNIRSIFLTHFHSDHIDGLGELMMNRWVQSNSTEPVPVYGPVGVESIVDGLRQTYALDATYRTAHHGEAIAPPSGAGGEARAYDLGTDLKASKIVLEEDGLKVTAFKVDHSPISPAIGYKFEYGGRSVVISGDTVASDSVLDQARGADVLVHEVLQTKIIKRFEAGAKERGLSGIAKIMHDIPDYHTTPEEAAALASEAGVKYLLFYHVVPPLPKFFDKALLGDARDHFDGPIKVGQDGWTVSLPRDSDKVEAKSLL
jgi:ribonuclease Z